MALTAAAGAMAQQQEDAAPEVVLGRPSAIRALETPAETVQVAAGTRLYALPDRRSALLDVAGADAPRPVLERADGWVLVRLEGQAGWAAVVDGRTGPEIQAAPARAYLDGLSGPLAPLPERLDRARSLLAGERRFESGPFTLYSDLADDAAIDLIRRLIEQLPATYAARYGVAPAPADRFAVVVFTAEASYRDFERADRELVELEASGHAAGNIAALYAEGRRRPEIGPILLHELTHLLNRSAFRGALPPWLEEGMAEDLSFSRIDRRGRLEAARLGGSDRRYLELEPDGGRTVVTELWGAPATLTRLVAALRADQLLPLPDLMALSRREMTRLEGRPLRYGQSAFLVRYLLDGAGPEARQGLHRFLARVAAGGDAEAADLAAALELDWPRLTRGYGRWLAARAQALEADR